MFQLVRNVSVSRECSHYIEVYIAPSWLCGTTQIHYGAYWSARDILWITQILKTLQELTDDAFIIQNAQVDHAESNIYDSLIVLEKHHEDTITVLTGW